MFKYNDALKAGANLTDIPIIITLYINIGMNRSALGSIFFWKLIINAGRTNYIETMVWGLFV